MLPTPTKIEKNPGGAWVTIPIPRGGTGTLHVFLLPASAPPEAGGGSMGPGRTCK